MFLNQIKYVLLYLLHTVSLIIQKAICTNWIKYIRSNETDVSFNTSMISEDSIPLMMCVTKCRATKYCRTVQVNKEKSKCELLSYYPPDNEMSATERIGWRVYFLDLKEVTGTNAWQSSTHGKCNARKAIDGKLGHNLYEGYACVCAHTTHDYGAWAMEFQYPGSVATVFIYFRNDGDVSTLRNTNFTISIHDNFDNAKDTTMNGTLCNTYTGEAITAPKKFQCEQLIYGKALRIKRMYFDVPLQLCEVKVLIA